MDNLQTNVNYFVSAGVYSALSSTASIPQNSTLRLHTKLDPGLGLGEGEARTAFNEDQVNRIYILGFKPSK